MGNKLKGIGAIALLAMAVFWFAYLAPTIENHFENNPKDNTSSETDSDNSSNEPASSEDPLSWAPAYVPEGGDEGDTPTMPDGYLPPDDPSLWPRPTIEYYIDEDGTEVGKGRVWAYFYKSAGVDRAREIVKELGYTWISGMMTGDSLDDFSTEILVPDGKESEAVERLSAYSEVSMAGRHIATKIALNEVEDESQTRSLLTPASDREKYHLYASYAQKAWSTVKCNGKVTVAVIDSGKPKLSVTDLVPNVDMEEAYDAISQCKNWGLDNVGHGTMVSGIISAVAENASGTDGASYNARILPIRVTTNADDFKDDILYLVQALEYLDRLNEPPQVINMSVGYPENGTSSSNPEQLLARLRSSIKSLHDKGTVLVAACGNKIEQPTTSGFEWMEITTMYPACLGEVISVGALSYPEENSVDSILAKGGYPNATIANFTSLKSGIDISAYGENITVLSTLPGDLPGFMLLNEKGTSFSAPQVAGAAALIKVAHPGYSADDIENALFKTAIKLDAMNGEEKSDEYGYGALDIAASIKWSSLTEPGNPDEDWSPTAGGNLLEMYREQKEAA